MKEVNINHIDMDLDGDGIPEKYIFKDKALNALFLTLANIAFSSDYNDLINQPDSLPASDVYEWAKSIAKPEYTKNEIGLENVDNTSDLNKPVSIAQQKAIDDAYANSNGYTDQKVSALEQAIRSKANQNEFDSHVGNDTIHITSSERNKWNSAISGTDDTKDNIVSFTSNDTTNPTSWSDVSALTSGEKHTSIFTKISTMFKNIRYLYKLIGTTDISAIGNGTVTNALYILNTDLSNKSTNGHKHTKSEITDFPSSLPASGGTASGIYDYNDGRKTIKVGYSGASLNTSNLNYIAGYTDGGTKIKDVSKDTLKSWLGVMKPDIQPIAVVVPSGSSSPTNINAPNVSDYNFLCWVGVSSQGFVGSPYIESYISQSTKIWDKNPGSGSYEAIALYIKA